MAFNAAGSLDVPRGQHSATLLADGRILVMGGLSSSGVPISQSEIWDPVTTAFSLGALLDQPRGGHTATLLADGRVMVTGGSTERDFGRKSVEIWDPAGGALAPANPTKTP